MNKPHKHCELIKAWADGAKIESRFCNDDEWAFDEYPNFYSHGNWEYRTKPEPKPDYVVYCVIQMQMGAPRVVAYGSKHINSDKTGVALKITLDGESESIKDAEVVVND